MYTIAIVNQGANNFYKDTQLDKKKLDTTKENMHHNDKKSRREHGE